MTRIHALVISVAVSFAVVAGAFAAFRTTRLGEATATDVSPVVLATQNRALDRSEAALARSIRAHPPKLPKVPNVRKPHLQTSTAPAIVHVVHLAAAATPATTTVAAQTTPPKVVTNAPTTTTKSSPHGREHEAGSDNEHETTTTTTTTTKSGTDD